MSVHHMDSYGSSQHPIFFFLAFIIIIISIISSWATNEFLPHYFEGQRSIHLCVAWLRQVGLTEPIPLQLKPQPVSSNLNAHLGHGHMAVSIKEALCTGYLPWAIFILLSLLLGSRQYAPVSVEFSKPFFIRCPRMFNCLFLSIWHSLTLGKDASINSLHLWVKQ